MISQTNSILDTLSLTVNDETNWFSTCRDSYLEIIGPMLGYYLRTKAEHFCKNLSNAWNSCKNFDDDAHVLSICDKAVLPFIVELSVSEKAVKQLGKFVHLSDDNMRAVKLDDAASDKRPGKITIHEIKHEYQNWAWSCLNTGNVLPFTEDSPVTSSRADISPQTIVSESSVSITNSLKTRCGRLVKKKKFFE